MLLLLLLLLMLSWICRFGCYGFVDKGAGKVFQSYVRRILNNNFYIFLLEWATDSFFRWHKGYLDDCVS